MVAFSFVGLGMLGGPVLQLGSSWKHAILMIPKNTHTGGGGGGGGGERYLLLAMCLLGLGVSIFTTLEGLDHLDAIYASFIVGKSSEQTKTNERTYECTPLPFRSRQPVEIVSDVVVMMIIFDNPPNLTISLSLSPLPRLALVPSIRDGRKNKKKHDDENDGKSQPKSRTAWIRYDHRVRGRHTPNGSRESGGGIVCIGQHTRDVDSIGSAASVSGTTVPSSSTAIAVT